MANSSVDPGFAIDTKLGIASDWLRTSLPTVPFKVVTIVREGVKIRIPY